jgi:hypothetical protein
MAKKAGKIAPFEILARIHFNLQVAVCPAKIWYVHFTYHNYINPNNCFPCVAVDLGKYVLYASALSRQAHWRTSLAMLFGGAGVSSFLMENIVDDDNKCDFQHKGKKTRTQRYIYACRDTEDGPLDIIPLQELLWYRFYISNFYIYKDEKLLKAF